MPQPPKKRAGALSSFPFARDADRVIVLVVPSSIAVICPLQTMPSRVVLMPATSTLIGRCLISGFALWIVAALSGEIATAADDADLILHHGKIVTVDDNIT